MRLSLKSPKYPEQRFRVAVAPELGAPFTRQETSGVLDYYHPSEEDARQ